ncbi:T9SS type A sorting domain-containing protein [Mangrovimonas aestuarii]|uniref:hypothetical protein n=1 Tax=Mangrovimonas aestuarii TaxID=3018443 RepID=UPI0023791484|nr:hypothetical protein [Mangrovimonas aestuarii]
MLQNFTKTMGYLENTCCNLQFKKYSFKGVSTLSMVILFFLFSSNVFSQDYEMDCSNETAFARCSLSACFLDSPYDDLLNSNRWGWTNGPYPYTVNFENYLDLLAGVAHCDIENNGFNAGTVWIKIDGDGNMDVEFSLNSSASELGTVHVYVGCDPLPSKVAGNKIMYTVAPGQYPYSESPDSPTFTTLTIPAAELSEILDGCDSFYFIAHSEVEVCEEVSCEVTGIYNSGQDKLKNLLDGDIKIFSYPFDDNVTIRSKHQYNTDIDIQVYNVKGIQLFAKTIKGYQKGDINELQFNTSKYQNQILFVKYTTKYGTEIKQIFH